MRGPVYLAAGLVCLFACALGIWYFTRPAARVRFTWAGLATAACISLAVGSAVIVWNGLTALLYWLP